MEHQIDIIKQKVIELLSQDKTGHGVDHIDRVLTLALKFAQQEQADINLVTIIALLHDTDDYKLFGHKASTSLPNAQRIMQEAGLDLATQDQICTEIQHLGYSKRLQNIKPQTLEGQIVSDADMCDGLGVHGILRTYQYGIAHHRPFFQKENSPNTNYNLKSYIISNASETSVDHFFEKLLRLKDLMLTPSGKHEAETRHNFTVDFLRQLFQEENATEWLEYLDNYLTKMEAPTGIEPVYAVLQTAASPLRHSAIPIFILS